MQVNPPNKVPVNAAEAAASALTNELTLPMPGRAASQWLVSTPADFALVVLNWLLIGGMLVPMRMLFPDVRGFASAAPFSLLGMACLQAALISVMGFAYGLHSRDHDLSAQARILGKAILWATTILCLVGGAQLASRAAFELYFGAGAMHFSALLGWRWQMRKRSYRQWGGGLRTVVIVGAGGTGRRVAAYVNAHPEAGRTVCGFLDNERPLGNGVIGRVGDLARVARTGFVDEVILAAPHDRGLTQEVLRESRRLRLDVEIVPELFGCRPIGREVERVGDSLVICVHAERLPEIGLGLKRMVDAVGAVLALTFVSPLLALIAGLIKLDSPGPVLYCAQRAGRKGQRFRCCKFRTMVSDADAMKKNLQRNNQRAGPFFKIKDDPRITRLGRFLRRYSLDELPQLWNVLKGEMSLVGPRPHPLDDVAGYEIEHLARLDVTPGITGLWQVTARRDPSFQRGMELDREYIRTWSLASDLRILLRTFFAVVGGSGD